MRASQALPTCACVSAGCWGGAATCCCWVPVMGEPGWLPGFILRGTPEATSCRTARGPPVAMTQLSVKEPNHHRQAGRTVPT